MVLHPCPRYAKIAEIGRDSVSMKTGSVRDIRATKRPENSPKCVPYALKLPRNHIKCRLLRVRACPGRRRGNQSGSKNRLVASPRKRTETAVFAKTRRSCSSRPREAAREVAYRYGAASMSTLRKNCRDRVGFREPENGLVTGDTGHKTP